MKFRLPVIRYEALWDSPEAELARLVKRLGLPFDDAKIKEAVAKNQISELQKTSKQVDQMVPPSHFRKGGYGGFADTIPPKIVAHIEREFADYQRRWRYA